MTLNPTPLWLLESAATGWAWLEVNGFYVLALMAAIAILYPRVKRRADAARSKATDYAADKVQEFEAKRRAQIRKQQEDLDKAKEEHLTRKRLELERDREHRLEEIKQKARRLGVGHSFMGKGERLDGS